MIRTLIIDDESHCTDSLQLLISKYCPQLEVIGAVNDPLLAVDLIRELRPELLFLDIEMRPLNGFAVLEKTRDIPTSVIFTTAYDEFAIRAIRLSALDYLLKPIDRSELISAVEKAVSHQKSDQLQEHLNLLFDRLNIDQQFDRQKIALPTHESVEIVYLKDIIRCQAESNYTTVFFTNGTKLMVSKTLKEIDDMIHSKFFFRAHKSHLVNLLEAKKYIRGLGGSLVMSDGQEVPVARTRKDELLVWLEQN